MAAKILRRQVSENEECLAFIDWTKRVRYAGEPLFERIVKIPNERGKRGVMTAILAALGMRTGFPDYLLLLPTPSCPGLFLEAKRIGGTIKADQVEWREKLRRYGYESEICSGAVELIEATRSYLNRRALAVHWVDRTAAIA